LEISEKQLAIENFERNLFSLRKKNDFLFIYLMLTQWAFSIICSFMISPYTWIGTQKDIHYHIWLAIVLGAFIALPPIFCIIESPGRKLNMYIIAISQGCFSGMLIHLMGGRIEAHFHIFGSLALLAFYKDWKILIVTSSIVAIDHLCRGIYFPLSVFGTPEASSWRWLEHTAWVVFEDVFLITSIFQTRADIWKDAIHQATATLHRIDIEKIVETRTKELEEVRAHSFHSAKLASLGEMAGNIAHEINNPLAIIMSTAELMKRKLEKGHLSHEDENAFKEKLDKIEKVVNRTSKIIQGLRNLSRTDQNEAFQNVCLGLLIDSTLELCSEKFKLHSIDLRLDLERPCLINGREVQLSQVILNLLNNAFDAIQSKDDK